MDEFIHDEYTRKAMVLVRQGHSFFITGKAGTGKTRLLMEIVRECRARGKNIAVSAPTGIAAKNAEGKTLHTLFGLKTSMFIPGKIRMRYRLDSAREKVVRSLDILIIDEISMVRCDLLDKVNLTLQYYKGNKKPFGGIQVLLFGDLFQLPPVVTDDDKSLLLSYYDNQYFFASDVIKKHPLPLLELRKVHRQENDLEFVKILNNIREGVYLAEDRNTLNRRLKPGYNPSEKESAVYLRTRNRKVWGHNIGKLEELPGEEKSFKAYIEDWFPKEQYPTDYELRLKVGAKVMLLRNDNDNYKFVNGTQGIISSIYDGTIRVETDEGDLISVEKSTWDVYDYVYNEETKTIDPVVVGSFTQYPIKLAWAVTIHKSQGMTFDKVIVDARRSFASGQVYVALSRCRSLAGLTLTSRITAEDIMVDPIVVEYMKTAERINPDEVESDERPELLTFFFSEDGKTITGISSEIYGNIEIPEGVEIIAEKAFENNTNITGVICPDSLREIRDRAFIGCRNLNNITLNAGLNSIGMEAFLNTDMGCVDLPYTLEEIGLTPFDCEMNVHVLNPIFSDIGGVLYDHEEETLILYPRKICSKLIEIPESVIRIEAYAFENNSAEEISIPEEIVELEEHLFNGCQKLRTLSIKSTSPESIEISEEAFKGFEVEKCVLRVPFEALTKYKGDKRFKDFKNITAIEGSRCLIYDNIGKEIIGCDEEGNEVIEIPEGVTSIKEEAFENNDKIESVNLPNSLLEIGQSAFSLCEKITHIELNDGLTTIGYDAFKGTGLTQIDIPETVNDIGFSAFNCKMKVDLNNTDYCDNDGVLYSLDETKLILYPSNMGEDKYEVPYLTECICPFAFDNSCLSNISLPDGLIEIEDYAFSECTELKSLTIPETVETLGRNLFDCCSELRELIFNIRNPKNIQIDENLFDGFNKRACKLFVPYGCKALYLSCKQFQGFINIVEMDNEDVVDGNENYASNVGLETGQYFDQLPGYLYSEGKIFCYIDNRYHCNVVSSSDGFFLKMREGGYYFMSAHISEYKYGKIWVHNKRDRLSSYDVSYSTDSENGIVFGHFIEDKHRKTITYRDLKSGDDFTIDLQTGKKI